MAEVDTEDLEDEKSVDELEEETFEVDDSAEVPPVEIIAYNELRSCADLYRMYDRKILEIQPEFQRDVVWKGTDQTRFIDSLVKELPIPSMCFALDSKIQQWIVIDGLQRMATIVRFLEGGHWKLSKLDDIDPKLSGRSVAELKTSTGSLHNYFSRVENLTIPITVLRCDFSKAQHMEYLFTIFHRLNSGGSKLSNQEIRNGIYGGSLNSLIRELDQNKAWRRVNKLMPKGSYRFRYQEVILRFFALLDNRKRYEGQLAKFLNNYMHANRNADEDFLEERKRVFEGSVEFVWQKVLSRRTPSKKIPITILEALLIGVAANLETVKELDRGTAKQKYQRLIEHPEFSEEARKEGLSKKDKVISRLAAAIEIFAAN